MKIIAERQVNKSNNNVIYDIVTKKRIETPKLISLFPGLAEKKRLISEAKMHAAECKKEEQRANFLLADFKIEQENAIMYTKKADNIKAFAKHEFIFAKKLLDESALITKNEKKRRKENNNTYVRVKKRKLAGGLEIDDYTNGVLTRKIIKIGDSISIMAVDLNNKTSYFSFNNNGELLTYMEDFFESEKELSANEKFMFEEGRLSTVDVGYSKYGNSSERSKKHLVFRKDKLSDFYRSYIKFFNQEIDVSAAEYFKYSYDFLPSRYYKNYTCDKDKKIESFIEYKYETIDFYSYLKDMKKQTIPTSENEKGQTIISRFRRKKIKALCIQDERTNRQKFFSFDLEENPINYSEDVLEN